MLDGDGSYGQQSYARTHQCGTTCWLAERYQDESSSGISQCQVGAEFDDARMMSSLRNDGIKIWAVSPRFLATRLGGLGAEVLKKMCTKDPSEGGNFIRDVVESKRDHEQGNAIRADMVQAC